MIDALILTPCAAKYGKPMLLRDIACSSAESTPYTSVQFCIAQFSVMRW
jgi:hypothetical protein